MMENNEYSSNKSAEEKNQSHSGSKTDAVDKINLQVFLPLTSRFLVFRD